MNEVIKIILIFLVVYIVSNKLSELLYTTEGFEDNEMHIASLYNDGEAILPKNTILQEDASIKSEGSMTIKSMEGTNNDIFIESGEKRVIIKGDLEIDGNLNVLGDLKVGNMFVVGDDKITMTSDGRAKFYGPVTIKDKYKDDDKIPSDLKTEYKEPVLSGSTYGFKSRRYDSDFNDIVIGSTPFVRTWGDSFHNTWMATPKLDIPER